jgi:hypothetical protein
MPLGGDVQAVQPQVMVLPQGRSGPKGLVIFDHPYNGGHARD